MKKEIIEMREGDNQGQLRLRFRRGRDRVSPYLSSEYQRQNKELHLCVKTTHTPPPENDPPKKKIYFLWILLNST